MRAATVAAVAFAVLGAGTAWAYPPSAITNALVANMKPSAETLDSADTSAETQSNSAAIRAFARRDSARQAATLAALEAWAAGIRRDAAAEAAAPTIDHLGPVLYLFSGSAQADPPGSHLTGEEREALARLAMLRGIDFDAAYLSLEAATLNRQLDLFTDYIRNGDDEVLRALAVRTRPKLLAAIAQLPRRRSRPR